MDLHTYTLRAYKFTVTIDETALSNKETRKVASLSDAVENNVPSA